MDIRLNAENQRRIGLKPNSQDTEVTQSRKTSIGRPPWARGGGDPLALPPGLQKIVDKTGKLPGNGNNAWQAWLSRWEEAKKQEELKEYDAKLEEAKQAEVVEKTNQQAELEAKPVVEQVQKPSLVAQVAAFLLEELLNTKDTSSEDAENKDSEAEEIATA